MHSTPPLGSPSWNIVIWCGYTMVKKLRICLAVSTEYQRVTNRQTYRHRATHSPRYA